MANLQKLENDRQHAKALKARIETTTLQHKIGQEAKNSTASKTREHLKALEAQRDALHGELGKKVADEASKIQKANPHVPMHVAYITAGKRLGL